jgi:hypothetical protein
LVAAIVFGYATAKAQADDKEQIQGSIAALAFSVSNGDSNATKKYVINEENNQKLAASIARIAKGSKELQKAAVAKFGSQGKEVGDAGLFAKHPPYMPYLSDLEPNKSAINGDTATVPPKHSYGRAVTFRKEGGAWKLELQSKSNRALELSNWAGHMADFLQRLAKEINNGKYSTAEQAQQAYLNNKYETSNKDKAG